MSATEKEALCVNATIRRAQRDVAFALSMRYRQARRGRSLYQLRKEVNATVGSPSTAARVKAERVVGERKSVRARPCLNESIALDRTDWAELSHDARKKVAAQLSRVVFSST